MAACRIILGIALLLATAVARAQEDDDLLEEAPLGPPIPERLEALEREWDREAGVAAPVEDDHPAEADPDPPVKPGETGTEDDEVPNDHDAEASEDTAGKKRVAGPPMKSRKGPTADTAEKPTPTSPSTAPKPPDPEADSD